MAEPLSVGTLTIPAAELLLNAVRASGPGGQNVNKLATKVELRFDFEHSRALSPEVKARLRTLAAGRLDADGCLLVTSQATRTQAQNIDDARAKLALLIARALVRPKRRKASRPSRAAKAARLAEKRKHSDKKRTRRAPPSD